MARGEGLTHPIVDRSGAAKKAFATARLVYTEAEVLQFELSNTPGALEKFARPLAEEIFQTGVGVKSSARKPPT